LLQFLRQPFDPRTEIHVAGIELLRGAIEGQIDLWSRYWLLLGGLHAIVAR
jgi:hypothetical protein